MPAKKKPAKKPAKTKATKPRKAAKAKAKATKPGRYENARCKADCRPRIKGMAVNEVRRRITKDGKKIKITRVA